MQKARKRYAKQTRPPEKAPIKRSDRAIVRSHIRPVLERTKRLRRAVKIKQVREMMPPIHQMGLSNPHAVYGARMDGMIAEMAAEMRVFVT